MPKPSKQLRAALKLLRVSRGELADMVREEMLELPKLPPETRKRVKAGGARKKKA
jgi:hypothetical protein